MMNNKNTHACMQTEANVMFVQIHSRKGTEFFGESNISAMMKTQKIR